MLPSPRCSLRPRNRLLARPLCSLLILLVATLVSCSDHATPTNLRVDYPVRSTDLPDPDTQFSALWVGNSHSAPIPEIMQALFEIEQPQLKVCFRAAPTIAFLDQHAQSGQTRQQIQKGKWSCVVLQAQKYSTSGQYEYPIDGAIQLSQWADQHGAKVWLFPEWSRKDLPDEHLRIEAIHQSIAQQTGDSIAPMGRLWAFAQQQYPDWHWLAEDGNHATTTGNYLTACYFYYLFTDRSPVQGAQQYLNESQRQAIHQLVRQFATAHPVDSLKPEPAIR